MPPSGATCSSRCSAPALDRIIAMQGKISDLVPTAARRFGDDPAFTLLGGATTSFAAIERQVTRFAGWLARQGIGRQDRVVRRGRPNGREGIVA